MDRGRTRPQMDDGKNIMINFFDITAMTLLILRYYGLIEISGWWIAFWFLLGFVESVLQVFLKEMKKK